MKKFTLYLATLLCGLILTAGLSSCVGDGDDNSIDAATQKTYLNNISGTYYYTARFHQTRSLNGYQSTSVKYDSLENVAARFLSDSTYRVAGFPLCKLDSAVNVDATVTSGMYRELFDAIHNSNEHVTISGFYWIPNTDYLQSTYYMFVASGVFQTKLHYNDADHNVAFYFSPSYSYGYYLKDKQKPVFQLYLTAIYLDYSVSATGNIQGSQLTGYFNPVTVVFE